MSRYVKLYEKINNSPVGNDVYALGVLTKLLTMARWKAGRKVQFGSEFIELQPGDVEIVISDFAKSLRINYTRLRRVLIFLEKNDTILRRSCNMGTIVTICNWSQYQGKDSDGEKPMTRKRITSEQRVNNERITSEKRTPNTTSTNAGLRPPKKEVEGKEGERREEENMHQPLPNSRTDNRSLRSGDCVQLDHESNPPLNAVNSDADNDLPQQPIWESSEEGNVSELASANLKKPKRSAQKKRTATPDDISLSKRWAEWTFSNWPHLKIDLVKWAESIAKTKRVMKFNHEQMVAVFEFASTDDFWKDNVQSPTRLLVKSKNNDQRKIDNILTKLKRKHFNHNDALDYARQADRGGPKLNEGLAF